MSYDEFPPVSPQNAADNAERANNEPETSSADAPPARSPRRRRAGTAGTAAASAPEVPDSVETKPTRSRSRRKTNTAQETNSETTETEPKLSAPTEPSSLSVPDPGTPAKAASRRRAASTRKKATETTADTPVADSAPPAELVPEPAAVETARPARGRRGRKEPATAPNASPPAETAPESVTPEPIAAEAPQVREAEAPPVRNARNRSRKPAAAREKPAAAAPVETSTEPAAPEPVADAPKQSSRRSRNRKTTGAPEAEPTTAEVVTPLETSAAAETAEPAERAGRRRRGGRSRKSPAENAAPAVEETVAAPEETAASEAIAPETETPAGKRRRARERTRSRRERPEKTEAEVAPVSAADEEERIDRTVGAHLITRQGIPEIHINGVPYPPVLFFGNMEEEKGRARVVSEVRRAARQGVHLHSTIINLPCPITEDSAALDEIDNRLRAVLDADAAGFVMPRIVFFPARGWKREYPTDISTYADGTTGDPSITSERFWLEAEHSLATLISHIGQQEWGKRIFGYHMERGEWFQPADQGYDRSIANRDAFRDWLREKYKNNLVSLRAAWYDGDVQFHTAEIPPLVTKPNQIRAFYETRRERRYIDFNEFTSETTAKRLIALARAVKKATNNQALVSVCYGYTFEFGHPFSGHLALNQLLSANAINLISGPPSYRDRKSGGAASFPAPVDSPPLHGKLWLSEDDTKTYLAPVQQPADDFNPRLGDRATTEQAQMRAIGSALAHHVGVGFMDLWGEGWLDDDSLWERIGNFTSSYVEVLKHHDRPRTPEVVALIDEKSLLHIQRGEPFFRRMTNGLRETLQRSGVSYGVYLQSDLLSARFPTEAKLYLFLTPYRLTTEQRQAIREKLQRGGKTLAWLYAPGSCEENPGIGGVMEEAATATVGFTLRQQEWNSEIGSRILKPDHPLTERMHEREYGTRERLNPSFFVDDPDATVLAEYQGSGLTSLAVKTLPGWKSVFVGDPGLPLELLRGICRYAGVHVWTPQGDDVTAIGDGWVMIHGSRDGNRTLNLPQSTGLYDVSERRLISDETRDYKFFLRAGTTRLFCVAPVERMVKLGLSNLTLPNEGRARVVVNVPAPELPKREPRREAQREREPVRETAPVSEPIAEPGVPLPTQDDLATLEAVLKMDISAYDDLELEEPEDLTFPRTPVTAPVGNALTGLLDDSEPGSGRRRRRRRGGRGRGRRRDEPGGDNAASNGGEGGEPGPPE